MSGYAQAHKTAFGQSLRAAQQSAPPTIPESEEEVPRPKSMFVILAAVHKDHVSSDEDDDPPQPSYSAPTTPFALTAPVIPAALGLPTTLVIPTLAQLPRKRQDDYKRGLFLRTLDLRPLLQAQKALQPPPPPKPMTSTTGSRFRIVPVAGKYKRSRWHCHDFYEPDREQYVITSHRHPKKVHRPTPCPRLVAAPATKPAVPVASAPRPAPTPVTSPAAPASTTSPASTSTASPSVSPPQQHHAVAVAPAVQLTPLMVVNRSSRSLSDVHPVPATAMKLPPVKTATPTRPPPNSPTQPVPTPRLPAAVAANPEKPVRPEILAGLEKSLTHTQEPRRTKSVAYNPASTAPIAHAIDSKIEQAMDLVKTHLMFAVREEVDTLRHKIHDLETNVQKLELENTILKKHVPEEVLRSLNRH